MKSIMTFICMPNVHFWQAALLVFGGMVIGTVFGFFAAGIIGSTRRAIGEAQWAREEKRRRSSGL
jgi:ABC-type lipoprotein release transport system permease subunit